MSKTVRMKWNPAGTKALLTGAPTAAVISQATDMVHANAGEEFDKRVKVGSRARGYVVAESMEARRKQAKHHTLENAAGRSVL